MKKATILICALMLSLFSCGKKENNEAVAEEPQVKGTTLKQLPKIFVLIPEYQEEVDKWTPFRSLEIEVENFKQQKPSGVLLSVDELLRLESELSKSPFPEKFDIPALKSRIMVFKTFVMEAKALLEENVSADSINPQQIKILNAFNALKKQFAEALDTKTYDDFLKKADSLNINSEFEKLEDQ